jgi:hypothetical protein
MTPRDTSNQITSARARPASPLHDRVPRHMRDHAHTDRAVARPRRVRATRRGMIPRDLTLLRERSARSRSARLITPTRIARLGRHASHVSSAARERDSREQRGTA